MRHLLLFSFLTSLAGLAAAAVAGCGDDPGASDLGYAYPLDATPDGVVETNADADINRH
jgi:hypothetical protein